MPIRQDEKILQLPKNSMKTVILSCVAFFILTLGAMALPLVPDKSLVPSEGLLKTYFQSPHFRSEMTTFQRGKTFPSGEIHNIPLGTTIYPLRVNFANGHRQDIYFYKDIFDEWYELRRMRDESSSATVYPLIWVSLKAEDPDMRSERNWENARSTAKAKRIVPKVAK